MPDHLTRKQQRFIQEYTRDWNATAAAIRFGYAARSARQIAAENLSKPDIVAALHDYRQTLAAAVDIDTRTMVRHYARIAFSTVCPLDYMYTDRRGDYHLRPAEEWTQEMRLLCRRTHENRLGVFVEMRDRDHAANMLCRYTGGFDA